ncbi:MAG: helix-turn-helix domain-containing protein [Ferrovum myxofaciens]|nr:helix-turn-helix domain-containing protein [Ferrovum myxofaciens]
MLIQRAYRYRFYPTPDQADQLARSFGCARWIYNWELEGEVDCLLQQRSARVLQGIWRRASRV